MAWGTVKQEFLCYGCGKVLWHENRQIKAMVVRQFRGEVRAFCLHGCGKKLAWLTPGMN